MRDTITNQWHRHQADGHEPIWSLSNHPTDFGCTAAVIYKAKLRFHKKIWLKGYLQVLKMAFILLQTRNCCIVLYQGS